MRLTRRRALALSAAAASSALAAPTLARAAAPLTVTATTGMIADAARAVGGDLAEVRGLMSPGVDPHAWRQTRADVAAMAGADLVLWNGLYLEAQVEEFMADLAARRAVVAVAEAVPVDLRRGHDDYEGRFDPHVWTVPELWVRVIDRVAAAMSEARPEDAAAFAANAAAYRAQAERAGAYARETLGTVPERSRVLISAHDAFGYFGDAYGFEVLGVQGISTEAEAGLARIGELVELIVTRDVRAVFVESSVSDRNVRALVEGAAARGHELSIGAELYSDAMGAPGTYEGTWIGMIDHNATAVTRALGGTAPAAGMQGLLAEADAA